MFCKKTLLLVTVLTEKPPQQMVERIKNNLRCGSIILLHNGAKNTPEALPLIIDAIKGEGYEIVPISQLIPKGEYYTDHEGRMHLSEPN